MNIKFLCIACNTYLSDGTPPSAVCNYEFKAVLEQNPSSPWDLTPNGSLVLGSVKKGTYEVGKVYTFAWRVE